MLVEEIMSREIATLAPDNSIREAMALMKERGIRHLPIVDGTRLAGIISERDIKAAAPSILQGDAAWEEAEWLQSPVRRIMRENPVIVHPLDSVADAAHLMYQHKIGCLPVVSRDKLVGIVTETDILRCLVELMGVHKPGSLFEVIVPDRPGTLARVASIIKDHGVNITSVLTTQAREPNKKVLVFRVELKDPRPILEDIRAAGYTCRRAGFREE